MSKKCKDCEFCKLIYEHSWYWFWVTYKRYCTACEEIINGEEACEKWKKKEKARITVQRLEQVEEDIKRIIEILDK